MIFVVGYCGGSTMFSIAGISSCWGSFTSYWDIV